jgi:broad specificity phosphatase PhoE
VTRLLLLRHGQSEWNALGRWQGWADPGLSPLGRLQAEQAGRRLARGWTGQGTGEIEAFGSVVSSDLVRSLATAEILARELGMDPPTADPGLREFDVGEWSGLTRDEIEARWPGDLAKWRRGQLAQMPGGESRDHFERRILAALRAVAASHGNNTALVVTHGGVIGMIERAIAAPVGRERLTNLRGRWFVVDGERIEAGSDVVLLDPDLESPAITPVP